MANRCSSCRRGEQQSFHAGNGAIARSRAPRSVYERRQSVAIGRSGGPRSAGRQTGTSTDAGTGADPPRARGLTPARRARDASTCWRPPRGIPVIRNRPVQAPRDSGSSRAGGAGRRSRAGPPSGARRPARRCTPEERSRRCTRRRGRSVPGAAASRRSPALPRKAGWWHTRSGAHRPGSTGSVRTCRSPTGRSRRTLPGRTGSAGSTRGRRATGSHPGTTRRIREPRRRRDRGRHTPRSIQRRLRLGSRDRPRQVRHRLRATPGCLRSTRRRRRRPPPREHRPSRSRRPGPLEQRRPSLACAPRTKREGSRRVHRQRPNCQARREPGSHARPLRRRTRTRW
jgi:hypothetical protein